MNELLTRSATFEPSTFNAEKRSVDVVFASTTEVPRSDFEGPFMERLSLEPSAVDLSEIIGGPLLDNHDRFSSVRAILGVVQEAAVDGKRGLATVRFSERPEIEGVVKDVQSGVIRRVSAGYTVEKWETSKRPDGTRVKTAVRWTPKEISFTALGADPAARTRSREINMTEELQTQIRGIAVAVGVQSAFADDLIRRDMPLVEARAAMIAEAARSIPAIDGRAPAVVTRDAGDGLIERMADALYFRVNPGHKPAADARPYVGRRMPDLARELLRQRGLNSFGSDAEIVMRSLHSTSDFPLLLQDVTGKVLAVAYRAAPSGMKVVCRRGSSHPDFKGRKILRRGELPTLEKVNQDGEFKRGSIVEGKEGYSIGTYGKVFGMTRQTIINDDLGALADIAQGWGLAAQEFENGFLVGVLTSNDGAGPELSDELNLFDTDHGNMPEIGGPIEFNALSAARLAMRTMKGLDGITPINVTPKYLLAPATLETEAEQYLSTIYPAEAGNVNPFGGTNRLELVVDPRLDAINPGGWYVFSDPAILACIEYAYLEGYEGVQIETRAGFDVDGVEIRARLDFGAGAIDFRGAYRNPGASE